VCLDALANGVPLVNIEFDDFISPDPIADFNDFKWTATTGNELAETLNTISNIDDQTFYRLQEKGFEYVGNYFYPVTQQNMKIFM
jgi:hypothetical protein